MRFRTALGIAGVVIVVSSSVTGTLAQESSASHPADIRLGSCSSLGEVAAPLIPLVVPEGDPQGQAGASPVNQSVTEVPLPLTDILGASHAVAVHASPEAVGAPIACGEIGGALGDDGTLAIGLQAMNGAKVSGISYFTPTAAGDGTIVTVLLVDERGARDRGDEAADGVDEVADGAGDGADAADDVADGANAADGVGNVTVPPAPDRAADAGDPDDSDGAAAPDIQPGPTSQPGGDGEVDRPGRDSDRGGNGDGQTGGDRDHRGPGGNGGAARAGEDGSTSG